MLIAVSCDNARETPCERLFFSEIGLSEYLNTLRLRGPCTVHGLGQIAHSIAA